MRFVYLFVRPYANKTDPYCCTVGYATGPISSRLCCWSSTANKRGSRWADMVSTALRAGKCGDMRRAAYKWRQWASIDASSREASTAMNSACRLAAQQQQQQPAMMRRRRDGQRCGAWSPANRRPPADDRPLLRVLRCRRCHDVVVVVVVVVVGWPLWNTQRRLVLADCEYSLPNDLRVVRYTAPYTQTLLIAPHCKLYTRTYTL